MTPRTNRYDIGVFTNCKTDIESHCKDARTQFRGNATVLKCLAENFPQLADSCQVRTHTHAHT